jgi:hypothetical protein
MSCVNNNEFAKVQQVQARVSKRVMLLHIYPQ